MEALEKFVVGWGGGGLGQFSGSALVKLNNIFISICIGIRMTKIQIWEPVSVSVLALVSMSIGIDMKLNHKLL